MTNYATTVQKISRKRFGLINSNRFLEIVSDLELHSTGNAHNHVAQLLLHDPVESRAAIAKCPNDGLVLLVYDLGKE